MAKVLVIDDSAMMRLFLRQCLEAGGYEVDDWMPLSAMEIGDRVADGKPDLVLCDYQMPGLNGATVAKMVVKSDPQIPVAILTATRDGDREGQLKKLGVRRILYKPVVKEELLEAIREMLEGAPEA